MLSVNNPDYDDRCRRLYEEAILEVDASQPAEAGNIAATGKATERVLGTEALSQAVSIKPVQQVLF